MKTYLDIDYERSTFNPDGTLRNLNYTGEAIVIANNSRIFRSQFGGVVPPYELDIALGNLSRVVDKGTFTEFAKPFCIISVFCFNQSLINSGVARMGTYGTTGLSNLPNSLFFDTRSNDGVCFFYARAASSYIGLLFNIAQRHPISPACTPRPGDTFISVCSEYINADKISTYHWQLVQGNKELYYFTNKIYIPATNAPNINSFGAGFSPFYPMSANTGYPYISLKRLVILSSIDPDLQQKAKAVFERYTKANFRLINR